MEKNKREMEKERKKMDREVQKEKLQSVCPISTLYAILYIVRIGFCLFLYLKFIVNFMLSVKTKEQQIV